MLVLCVGLLPWWLPSTTALTKRQTKHALLQDMLQDASVIFQTISLYLQPQMS